MDLMDFEGENLYFEENLPAEVEGLIQTAGGLYGEGDAEPPLLDALKLAPESLNVLVALYRFYYYQHRLEDALVVARRSLEITAHRLNIPLDWNLLTEEHVTVGPATVALLRFHLLSLKAEAFLLLRLRRDQESRAILTKLVALDEKDRLKAKEMLAFAEDCSNEPA
jgi:hypothetical protein